MILIREMEDSDNAQLPEALEFLSDIMGLGTKDEAAFTDSFSEEEATDLVSLATLLNKEEDYTIVRMIMREHFKRGKTAKEALLQFCGNFKLKNEQEFTAVLEAVQERLSTVVTG